MKIKLIKSLGTITVLGVIGISAPLILTACPGGNNKTDISSKISIRNLQDFGAIPDANQILSVINNRNANINLTMNDVEITNINNTSATINGKGKYKGSVTVNFKIENSISNIITFTNWDWVYEEITATNIIDFINTRNNASNLTASDINVSGLSLTGATITGQINYQGNVTLQFRNCKPNTYFYKTTASGAWTSATNASDTIDFYPASNYGLVANLPNLVTMGTSHDNTQINDGYEYILKCPNLETAWIGTDLNTLDFSEFTKLNSFSCLSWTTLNTLKFSVTNLSLNVMGDSALSNIYVKSMSGECNMGGGGQWPSNNSQYNVHLPTGSGYVFTGNYQTFFGSALYPIDFQYSYDNN